MKRYEGDMDVLWRPSLQAPAMGFKGTVTLTKNYEFVDVLEKSKQIIRYRQKLDEQANQKGDWFIKESVIDASRYAVRYEPLVDPADRQYWVAGAKVTVIDQQNNEVMATKTWYALEPGQGATGNSRSPWRSVIICPNDGANRDPISKFILNVIKPKQGDKDEPALSKQY